MTTNLTDPMFTDADKARAHFEAIRWPNGPVCSHCGTVDQATLVKGKSHRPGLYQCNACRQPFTVTTGTVMESSHIPLNKWALGFHLMAASKKGVSAHQLHRMLGITYKSAWFMAHRIREAMRDGGAAPIGGEGKTVEADETYIGVRKEMRHKRAGGHHKMKVVALVERESGKVRAFHVDDVNTNTVRAILVENADCKSKLMTDEAKWYRVPGEEFASHGTVNHHAREYVSRIDGLIHTNTIEGIFRSSSAA